jgi:hypothetical protein
MRHVIFSCKGRLIGPVNGSFPSFYECLYGMKNTNRFRGQGSYNGNEYNVLKHSVLVAFFGCLLNGPRGFTKYILHEFEEVFVGDKPSTFRSGADKEFEMLCMASLRHRLFPNACESRDSWDAIDVTVPDMFLRGVEYKVLFPWNKTYYDEYMRYECDGEIPLPAEFDPDMAVAIMRQLIRANSQDLLYDLVQILPYTLGMTDAIGPVVSKFFSKYLKRSL